MVHWTNNSNTAELKAQEVFNALFGQTGVIGGHKVIMFDMKTDGPVSIGADSNGVFEYVINTKIIYER